jgi:cyclopropane fatty-acyl-phospholipid synthase-like methyltransferase
MTTPRDYEIQEVNRYYRKDHFFEFGRFFTDIDPNSRVLNLGCGRAASLQKVFTNGIGVDFNKNLVPLWQKLGLKDRCFVQDASDLQFEDDEFEWTISSDFFEHVDLKALPGIITETLRVAPRGIHVIHLLSQTTYRGAEGQSLHSAALNPNQWLQKWKRPGLSTTFELSNGHLVVKFSRA